MTIPAAGAGQTSAAQMPAERARAFRALHQGPGPLLLPNPWDAGSARLLASLGFAALATTSGGFAATLGRLDGGVTRDEALGHAAPIVAVTSLDDIRAVVSSVDRPVNVLTLAGAPTVPQLAEAGVRRISVGSAFSN